MKRQKYQTEINNYDMNKTANVRKKGSVHVNCQPCKTDDNDTFLCHSKILGNCQTW